MSLLRCEAADCDDLKPEECLETKKKIGKLETIRVIGNSGFPIINQNVLLYLDHKSQMAFRSVCQSWREQVDQPFIWIRKLNLKSYPKELGNVWIDLVRRIQKGSDLENEVTECLMKWYGKHQSYFKRALEGMLPIHIAAMFGCTNIAIFVASYSDNINAVKSNGLTPLHIAAQYGSTGVFKVLAHHIENPNVPSPIGWTPLHIAAQVGSTEIFKFLAPQVENPNAPCLNGWTPLHIAALNGSTEIFKFLVPQVENPNAPDPRGVSPLQFARFNHK